MKMKLIEKGNFKKALFELKNDTNNAVVQLFSEKNSASNGVLKNAVFTIKDIFATDDSPTQASSKILSNFKPFYNAEVVQRLLNNGAVKVAKVNSDELALGGTGTFSAYGIITNKFDKNRYAGGSSSGSATTLTKNISFALGSDTGDSVRLPASYNGCLGFKPSYGAISRYGMFAYSSSLDTVAYFAHNVNDIAVVSQVVYGVDNKDMTSVNVKIDDVQFLKPKKIIVLDVFNQLENYVRKAYFAFIKKLKDQGIEVRLMKVNKDILRAIKPTYDIISYSEASSNLSNLNGIAFGERENGNTWEEIIINTRTKGFGKMVQRRLSLGSFYLYNENQEEIFIKAQKVRRVIKEYWDNLLSLGNLIVFPSSPSIAPLFTENKKYDFMNYILTAANIAGNPSISIPFGFEQNQPFNLSIETKIFDDEKLLSYSLYLEKLIGEMNE